MFIMRRTFIIVMSALILLSSGGTARTQNHVTESIVKIYTTYDRPNYKRPWQMKGQQNVIGSGSIIAGRRILTNAHVVSDHTFIRVRRAMQAEKYVASVEAVSHELDLALLKVSDDEFFDGTTPIDIGSLPYVGDKVTALGFPKGGTRITITQGVVSRIERSLYSHSRYGNLVCQIDAAINPGSSGGPVISNDKLVGVIFQSTSGQNIGYMVPAPVVRHFLTDLQDGRHDGVPSLFFVWQNMENPQIRRYYRLSEMQSGVLIRQVSPDFADESMLRPSDVVLSVDGYDVANDGTVSFRGTERISFAYLIDRKQVGDHIELQLWRDGRPEEVRIPLEIPRVSHGYLVPRFQYEILPTYYIVGGLVFTKLTANYLKVWKNWGRVPVGLKKYYYQYITTENKARREVVLLMDVLPDELNVGYDMFKNNVIAEVNGIKINCMQDLVAAFENDSLDNHRILFEDHNTELILAADQLQQKGRLILAKYKVPHDRSPDLK